MLPPREICWRGGEVFRPSCSSTGQRKTIKKAADTLQWSCVCCISVLESLLTSERPEVNAIHYNIHEAAGLLSWAKAKPDMTKLTLAPSALRVKTAKKGTDEAQTACVTEDGCGWVGGLKLIMKATYFAVLTVLMILEDSICTLSRPCSQDILHGPFLWRCTLHWRLNSHTAVFRVASPINVRNLTTRYHSSAYWWLKKQWAVKMWRHIRSYFKEKQQIC